MMPNELPLMNFLGTGIFTARISGPMNAGYGTDRRLSTASRSVRPIHRAGGVQAL
jgi:hypothetical protein